MWIVIIKLFIVVTKHSFINVSVSYNNKIVSLNFQQKQCENLDTNEYLEGIFRGLEILFCAIKNK